jgi:hypothetical protein
MLSQSGPARASPVLSDGSVGSVWIAFGVRLHQFVCTSIRRWILTTAPPGALFSRAPYESGKP